MAENSESDSRRAPSAWVAPAVTVAVPVFNGARFLRVCLDAHLGQTAGDFELLILDNASTDSTPAIAAEYAARDPRVRYVRNARNIGAANNYNEAVRLARGRYFRWSASDDCVAPTSLARCLEVLESRPEVALVYPKTMLIDSDGNPLRPYDDGLHCEQADPVARIRHVLDTIGYCNALYGLMRTATVRRAGRMGSYPGSDIQFHAELALHGPIIEIPEHLFFRRMHEEASSKMTPQQRDEFYYPSSGRAVRARGWPSYRALFGAVFRAPLSLTDRIRLASHLLRRMVWTRDLLWRELRFILPTRMIRNRGYE